VSNVIDIRPAHKHEVKCASCNLRELCLPAGLCVDDLSRVEGIVYARRRLKRGEALFNAGAEPCTPSARAS
jgi:CRP/FNR family transcriptional regulator